MWEWFSFFCVSCVRLLFFDLAFVCFFTAGQRVRVLQASDVKTKAKPGVLTDQEITVPEGGCEAVERRLCRLLSAFKQ